MGSIMHDDCLRFGRNADFCSAFAIINLEADVTKVVFCLFVASFQSIVRFVLSLNGVVLGQSTT